MRCSTNHMQYCTTATQSQYNLSPYKTYLICSLQYLRAPTSHRVNTHISLLKISSSASHYRSIPLVISLDPTNTNRRFPFAYRNGVADGFAEWANRLACDHDVIDTPLFNVGFHLKRGFERGVKFVLVPRLHKLVIRVPTSQATRCNIKQAFDALLKISGLS